jgi:hypothetical protein
MSRITRSEPLANPLTKHLHGSGVLTSSELIARLCADGLTEPNARQVLSRYSNRAGIWRSERLRLRNDERLFAEKSLLTDSGFCRLVAEKLRNTNRWGMARCLEGLATERVLHKVNVYRLLAVSPDGNEQNGRRVYQSELAGLKEIGVRVLHQDTPLECIAGPFLPTDSPADHLASLAAALVRRESLLARVLIERFRRQNIFSWNKVDLPELHRPYTVFNGHVFTSHGFSYLSPLLRRRGNGTPIPCPVLLDVYHSECSLSHVHSFLQRIERATIRKSRLPALGVIAARDFRADAWSLARRSGLLTISLRDMFGDKALEAMAAVEELLHDLSTDEGREDAEDKFETFADILKDLKTNPVVAILRSIGFEALAALAIAADGYQRVTLGRKVSWHDTARDVDVFGMRGDAIKVIECKAYHKKKRLRGSEVTKFFTETVPALKKALKQDRVQFETCKAELWTTGPIGRDAERTRRELKAPLSDTWVIRKKDGIEEQLPSPIRARGKELLAAIAIERSETEDAVLDPSVPLEDLEDIAF